MTVCSSSQPILRFLNSLPIKFHRCTGAVDFQRAIRSDSIRPDENPVLPSGEPPEYARLHGFRGVHRFVRGQFLSDQLPQILDPRFVTAKPRRQSRKMIHHRQRAKIHLRQSDCGRRASLRITHVDSVGRQRQFEKRSREARFRLDNREKRPVRAQQPGSVRGAAQRPDSIPIFPTFQAP